MNFNDMPKVLCDQMHMNMNQSLFFFGFSSGKEDKAFVVPPALAKTFRTMLDEAIKNYESQFGEIDMRGTTKGISSPIQINK